MISRHPLTPAISTSTDIVPPRSRRLLSFRYVGPDRFILPTSSGISQKKIILISGEPPDEARSLSGATGRPDTRPGPWASRGTRDERTTASRPTGRLRRPSRPVTRRNREPAPDLPPERRILPSFPTGSEHAADTGTVDLLPLPSPRPDLHGSILSTPEGVAADPRVDPAPTTLGRQRVHGSIPCCPRGHGRASMRGPASPGAPWQQIRTVWKDCGHRTFWQRSQRTVSPRLRGVRCVCRQHRSGS